MKDTFCTIWFALAASLLATAAFAVDYTIVTASERGTYIKIGKDIAEYVVPSTEINLEVLPSAGSAENVRMLRYKPGVKLALVQSDVYQSYLDLAAQGNSTARAMIRPLRVIAPLYNEEVYFIVRADSERNYLHEIQGARINAGEAGSGTALTSATLYRLMFGEGMPDSKTSFLPNEEALIRLVADKTIDVVAVVAGQPARLLADMKPESRKLIKLLKFDPSHVSSPQVLRTYFPATVRAANYPALLSDDVASIAVKAFLVTYDFQVKDTERHLRELARSLCRNLSVLQEKGHPKWRDVDLSLPELGTGWFYYRPTQREIEACTSSEKATVQPAPKRRMVRVAPKACTQQERILGLCS